MIGPSPFCWSRSPPPPSSASRLQQPCSGWARCVPLWWNRRAEQLLGRGCGWRMSLRQSRPAYLRLSMLALLLLRWPLCWLTGDALRSGRPSRQRGQPGQRHDRRPAALQQLPACDRQWQGGDAENKIQVASGDASAWSYIAHPWRMCLLPAQLPSSSQLLNSTQLGGGIVCRGRGLQQAHSSACPVIRELSWLIIRELSWPSIREPSCRRNCILHPVHCPAQPADGVEPERDPRCTPCAGGQGVSFVQFIIIIRVIACRWSPA